MVTAQSLNKPFAMRTLTWLLVAIVVVAWPSSAAAQEPDPAIGVPFKELIQREAVRLASDVDQSGSLPRPRRQVHCKSRKHGAILGALIGGAAGAFAAYMAKVGGSSGRAGVALKFGVGGAGIGSVIGAAACSK
jgi:hypothetical protein